MQFTILFFSLLLAFSSVKVPNKVLNNFIENYADEDIDFVEWEKKWNKYIGTFTDDEGVKQEVFFNENSEWIYTKSELFGNSAPSKIMQGFKHSKYSNSEINKVKIILFPSKPKVYEFEVEIFDFKKKIYFNNQGKLIDIKL